MSIRFEKVTNCACGDFAIAHNLTKMEELEQCGFIRTSRYPGKRTKDAMFRRMDNYSQELIGKCEAFRRETGLGMRGGYRVTFITAHGLAHNKHWGTVQSEVTLPPVAAP